MKQWNWLKRGLGLAMLVLTALFGGCLTSLAMNERAILTSCMIENQNMVIVSGTAMASDDYYYLFELQPYESEIGMRTDYLTCHIRQQISGFRFPYSSTMRKRGCIPDLLLPKRSVKGIRKSAIQSILPIRKRSLLIQKRIRTQTVKRDCWLNWI